MGIKSRLEAAVTFPDIDPGVVFEPISGTVTLDVTRVPFIEARFTLPAPDEAFLAQIDPRAGIRVLIEATRERIDPADTDQVRSFDLLLHARTFDPLAGTVELVGWSDEAMLIDGGTLVTDFDAAPNSFGVIIAPVMLRDVVEYVLGKIGATLEPGTADADFTPTTAQQNLLPNPSFETNTTGWLSSTASAAITRQTVTAVEGTSALRIRCTSAISAMGAISAAVPVTPGQIYYFSTWARTALGKDGQARIRWYNSSAVQIGSDEVGQVLPIGTTYTEFWVGGQAPVGAATAAVYFLASGGFTTGQDVFIDLAMLRPDVVPPQIGAPGAWVYPFDGEAGSGWDAYLYTYLWDGPAHASASRRVPIDDRAYDLLFLTPGDTWWDFLTPMLQQSGCRLFCAEDRKWYLVDDTYTVPGTIALEPGDTGNLLEASDTITLESIGRDGLPLYYEALVITYTSTTGEQRYDIAPAGPDTASPLAFMDGGARYPGSGVAATKLARALLRGRQQPVTAVTDLDATPAMAATTQLPDVALQEGRISAVTFSFAADGAAHDTMALTLDTLEDA